MHEQQGNPIGNLLFPSLSLDLGPSSLPQCGSLMTKSKKRIEINAKQKPLTDLREAEINLSNLPAGPEESPNVSEPLWKLGRVVLRRERAHRGGKTVIVIDDFATHLPISVIEKTAKKIQVACGCGGTVKDRAIEIQGDQPGKIRAVLETEGFRVAGVK
jgi:translation initiation factor 1